MESPETHTQTFHVTGMTCGHCEMSVREEVTQVAGVRELSVSAQTGVLVVTGDGVATVDVLAAVDEAGYQAVPA